MYILREEVLEAVAGTDVKWSFSQHKSLRTFFASVHLRKVSFFKLTLLSRNDDIRHFLLPFDLFRSTKGPFPEGCVCVCVCAISQNAL